MCLGVPALVKQVDGISCTVSTGGIEMSVRCDMLDDVKPGDHVLVHAGFALGRIDKEQAEKTLRDIQKLLGDDM